MPSAFQLEFSKIWQIFRQKEADFSTFPLNFLLNADKNSLKFEFGVRFSHKMSVEVYRQKIQKASGPKKKSIWSWRTTYFWIFKKIGAKLRGRKRQIMRQKS